MLQLAIKGDGIAAQLVDCFG